MTVNRSWLYVGVMVIAAAVAGYMVSRLLARSTTPALQSGTALPAPRPLPAFTLADHLGSPFGNAQLSGRPALVFFGFTHCPDVCPMTLALLSQLQRDEAFKDLRMLFITVDPARDDQAVLQRYVAAFGGRFTGLRGDDAELDPLLLGLGAARFVQPRVGADYNVDHSAVLYYINSRGALSAVFTPPHQLAGLRNDLATLMESGH